LSKRKKIVVLGYMGICPIAGVVWQHVHYIVGLMRLGHDVVYIEDTIQQIYNTETMEWGEDLSFATAKMASLARQFGFEDRWGFRARFLPGMPTAGMSGEAIDAHFRTADAVLSVCGWQELNDDLLASDRLIYVESDPGVEQIKVDNGDAQATALLEPYFAHFTFGELVSTSQFPVPTHQFDWKPTRQPVVTDLWRSDTSPGEEAVFTTIANWSTSGLKDIDWRGDTYLWSKSLEFKRFIDAPTAVKSPLEMATTIPDDSARQEFLDAGWRLTPPWELSANADAYRSYIQNSRGEFTAAKDQYVRLNTGWFSDRSACYLAAGRPVITQETGFSQIYGGDRGLFGFRTLDDIAAAADAIASDYPAHCAAAAEIADEYFGAEKVLKRLLDDAGV